jgi:hypothetical protein
VASNVCRIGGETCCTYPFGTLKRKKPDDNIKMDPRRYTVRMGDG